MQRFESSLYTVDGMKDLGMSESLNEWFVLRAQSVNPYQREEDNRKMKNDITELIGIIKLYLKEYRIDKDEIQKCIERIKIQMEKNND